jgi:diacylglycerol O-acyltransferase / wax synthase
MAVVGGPGGADARPLSDEDLRILALESDAVVGHTCKVMLLDGPVDAEALRASIAARMDSAPELRLRLGEVDGIPSWVPAAELRLDEHIVEEISGALDRDGLRAEVGRIFEQRLDRSKPLWRIDVLSALVGGGSALVWRIHHALADGTTAMRIGREAVWNEAGQRRRRSARQQAARHRQAARLHTLLHEAPHPWHRSPFAGPIKDRRAVAFAHADLEALHRVASITCGATVNDAVLTVVSGGVRRWLESHHCHRGAVRVKVPVSLHGADTDHGRGEAEAGNRDSYFCLDLPLGPADPARRLRLIHRATRLRKLDHDAEQLDRMMHALGRTSPRLQRFAEQVLAGPRSFALNVSNVPGPRGPIDVLGTRVVRLYSIAEIGQRHALRVAVVSLAGKLTFGLCADPTVVPDVDHLAAAIEDEAKALAEIVALV